MLNQNILNCIQYVVTKIMFKTSATLDIKGSISKYFYNVFEIYSYPSSSFFKSSVKTSKQTDEQTSQIEKQPFADVFKVGVLKNFVIFPAEHLCWNSLFNKGTGLQVYNFIKKRLQHRCFLVSEYFEIFKNSFFYGTPPVVAFVG